MRRFLPLPLPDIGLFYRLSPTYIRGRGTNGVVLLMHPQLQCFLLLLALETLLLERLRPRIRACRGRGQDYGGQRTREEDRCRM